MEFKYEMYLRNDFYLPMLMVVLFAAMVVISILGMIQNFTIDRLQNILIIIAFLPFLYYYLVQTIRGIPLIRKGALNTINVQGIVEKIEYAHCGTKYCFNGDSRTSIYITIDGKKYYSAFLPGVHKGDAVFLVVLRNSKFVIKCVVNP